MTLIVFVLIFGFALIFLIWRLIQAMKRRQDIRQNFFAAILPKMRKVRRAITSSGFERISGFIDGALIDLQILLDTLTYRKLPCLWLMISRIEPLPLPQKISLMIRPTGFESFSPFSQLPYQTWPLPASFPPDIALRSEYPLTKQEMTLLQRHLAIFKDQRVKELVLTPQGLRISWLVEEAHRGRYLLFREAEISNKQIQWNELAILVEFLAILCHDITSQSDIFRNEPVRNLPSCA